MITYIKSLLILLKQYLLFIVVGSICLQMLLYLGNMFVLHLQTVSFYLFILRSDFTIQLFLLGGL